MPSFHSSECMINGLHTTNNFNHVFQIKIVLFIILVVCKVNYYQATEDPFVCTECPSGSTTNGQTDTDACGKYDRIIIPISR